MVPPRGVRWTEPASLLVAVRLQPLHAVQRTAPSQGLPSSLNEVTCLWKSLENSDNLSAFTMQQERWSVV